MSRWLRILTYLVVLGLLLWILIGLAVTDGTGQSRWHEPAPAPRILPSLPVARLGNLCSPEGAMARTASGNPMYCIKRPGENVPTWRME